jgi:transposase
LALRSRIVLACAEGRSNTEVAAACGVSAATVGKWRRRFCELRLDGLSDDPRPGRPATITAEQVEDVVVATLESAPENATHPLVAHQDGWAVRALSVDDRQDLAYFAELYGDQNELDYAALTTAVKMTRQSKNRALA